MCFDGKVWCHRTIFKQQRRSDNRSLLVDGKQRGALHSDCQTTVKNNGIN